MTCESNVTLLLLHINPTPHYIILATIREKIIIFFAISSGNRHLMWWERRPYAEERERAPVDRVGTPCRTGTSRVRWVWKNVPKVFLTCPQDERERQSPLYQNLYGLLAYIRPERTLSQPNLNLFKTALQPPE